MSNPLVKKLLAKESSLAVIGLGYVGLPIALEFGRQMKVIGYDINPESISKLKNAEDPSREIPSAEFQGREIKFTSAPEDLKQASVFIVAVPTPIDQSNIPDLRALYLATSTVGKYLKEGDLVVYESTVYPGATEEECLPVLEKESKLKAGKDFKIAYSPERINPGDKEHTLRSITKVVSGMDDDSLDAVSNLYSLIVDAGVFKASSIKVAEAAKIIENTQRDVNIALMNELSMIFSRMDINTYEVLEAAGTKWNFLNFYPGLVGGHCIGVDPYYLTYKAEKLRYYPRVILSGRDVNDSMGFYIARELVKRIIDRGKNVLDSRVLILGVTFKENVSDIRNSRIPDIVSELKSYGVKVEVVDPLASPEEVKREYGIDLLKTPKGPYNAIVVAVAHDSYKALSENDILKWCNGDPILVDVKGIFRDKVTNLSYWSL